MKLYPINELLGGMSSRYELVNLGAHRARQLSSEADESNIPLKEASAGTLVPQQEEMEV